uniref:Uncharacterized protein n=1 Tax=Rhizophora mucronata TaxID=61149 RepID=A0A2P2J5H2_RHIMU
MFGCTLFFYLQVA